MRTLHEIVTEEMLPLGITDADQAMPQWLKHELLASWCAQNTARDVAAASNDAMNDEVVGYLRTALENGSWGVYFDEFKNSMFAQIKGDIQRAIDDAEDVRNQSLADADYSLNRAIDNAERARDVTASMRQIA